MTKSNCWVMRKPSPLIDGRPCGSGAEDGAPRGAAGVPRVGPVDEGRVGELEPAPGHNLAREAAVVGGDHEDVASSPSASRVERTFARAVAGGAEELGIQVSPPLASKDPLPVKV